MELETRRAAGDLLGECRPPNGVHGATGAAARQRGGPDDALIREALYSRAYRDRKVEPPPEIAAALEWIAGHSRPLANLADQDLMLDALGRLLLAGPDDELAPLRMRIVAAVGANAGLLAAGLPEFAALLGAPPDAAHPLAAPLARWLDQATVRHLRLGNLPGRAWPPWSWSLIDREVAEVATQPVATEAGPAEDDSSPSS